MFHLHTCVPKVERRSLELYLRDELVGVIDPYQCKNWHAKIQFKTPNDFYTTLVQGFGDTPIAAVASAINDGLDYHRRVISKIEALVYELKETETLEIKE